MGGPKLTKGEISVAPYEDGSGDRVTVHFDRDGGTGDGLVTLEQYSARAIDIEYEHLGELIPALALLYY